MIAWVEKNTPWEYVLRTSPQIYVQTEELNQPTRTYPLEKGQIFSLHNVGFTQTSTLTPAHIAGSLAALLRVR